ncbi:MAG TPA: VOC family protein [Cyclobacteriaceae bacterium]|jgi:catechol 2,3-dioxygenase-like lactoylglutathione lyase family enzyme|nr:VOC family protein [Cyclobacteriaceae bacterium]
MEPVNKFMMLYVAVSDMPKSKKFYADDLGLKVVRDYRKDENNRWVSVAFPEGGVTLTLSTYHGNAKPGTMNLYFATSDVNAAYNELSKKGIHVNKIKDDLFGPGSGVKWFDFQDPDGHQIKIVQP